jgi:hypothetical protein
MLEKLKKLADQAKEKAAPLAEQAAHRAAELASEARVKAGPLAEQAKERAVDLAGKAAPAVSQGVDKAAERIDKATGGKYSNHLDKVQGAVHGTASKVAASAAGQATGGNIIHTDAGTGFSSAADQQVVGNPDPEFVTHTSVPEQATGAAPTAVADTAGTASDLAGQSDAATGSAAADSGTEGAAHRADDGTGQEPHGS